MASERDAAIAESRRLSEENDQLWHLLKQLQRAQFGRRSERLDPDQIQLALEDTETARAEREAEEEKTGAADTSADQGRKKRNSAITAVRCRRIFPAFTLCSLPRARLAPAARVRCMSSARTRPNVSMWSRRSIGRSSRIGPNTAAGPARARSSRPRLPDRGAGCGRHRRQIHLAQTAISAGTDYGAARPSRR